MLLTRQEKARGQPKKIVFWLLVLGLFASRRRTAGQPGNDHSTGRQDSTADPASATPPNPLPERRAATPPAGPIDADDRQREREMASDESARRATKLAWHKTAQIVVLITVVLVLSHALHLPVLTVVPIALGGLVSCRGGVGLFSVIVRWRQAGSQDDEKGSSNSGAEPSV